MIVHIGYHKTGTTYLQNKIFPNLKGIDFYGYMDKDKQDLLAGLIETPSIDIEIEKYTQILKGLDSKRLLYSNENLAGPLFYMTGMGKVQIAQTLKKIGAKKIIITIRNQITLLDSIYRQYIQEGGIAKFDFFIDKWRFSFDTNHLKFYKLISYYTELYGKENVLVILNEDLKNNETKVIKQLEAFTNSKYTKPSEKLNPKKANVSISNGSLKILRFVNHFVRSHHRPSNFLLPQFFRVFYIRYILQRFIDPYFISKISSKKSFVNERYAHILSEKYKKGNKKLAKEFNLDLEKYDYPV